MKYHLELFSWLAKKDKIFLLNGPSVERFPDHLERFRSSNPVLFGVNYIKDIERWLLNPSGYGIHVWVLLSSDEVARSADAIIRFLGRDDTVAIMTTTVAFSRIADILAFNDIPGLHKVVFCDAIVEMVHRATDLRFYSSYRYESPVAVNSLGLALMALSVGPRAETGAIYLFGCDGADVTSQENVYFREAEMEMGKRVTSERNIYQDMIALEAVWETLRDGLLTQRGWPVPTIRNVNPDSHYNIFPKMAADEIAMTGSAGAFEPSSDATNAERSEARFRLEMARASLARESAEIVRALRRLQPPDADLANPSDSHDSSAETELRLAIARRAEQVMSTRLTEVRSALVERTAMLETIHAELVDRTHRLEAATKALSGQGAAGNAAAGTSDDSAE